MVNIVALGHSSQCACLLSIANGVIHVRSDNGIPARVVTPAHLKTEVRYIQLGSEPTLGEVPSSITQLDNSLTDCCRLHLPASVNPSQ